MSPKLVQTYPRIVENWGITMAPLFLRLISWKSLPQSIWNSHFCHCQNQNDTFSLVQSADALRSEKVKFDKHFNWLGKTFSWYQSQNQWCHCNSPVFYCMRISLHEFWWHGWKFLKATSIILNTIKTLDDYTEGPQPEKMIPNGKNVFLIRFKNCL